LVEQAGDFVGLGFQCRPVWFRLSYHSLSAGRAVTVPADARCKLR
jgi:hypothetical protein